MRVGIDTFEDWFTQLLNKCGSCFERDILRAVKKDMKAAMIRLTVDQMNDEVIPE